MNGLKVYLKSGTTKVYVIAQAVVGIFLIVNALREYEHVVGHMNELLLNIASGVLLMLGATIPKRWRRNLRYVPGILIAVGGIVLFVLTKASMQLDYSRFNPYLLYFSYGLTAFGLLQPIIDIRHYAHFTTRGIRYRVLPFQKAFVLWADVEGIVYNEGGFDLALRNGKSFKMQPYNANSTNLRMHVDKMFHAGRQGENKDSSPEKEGKIEGSPVV